MKELWKSVNIWQNYCLKNLFLCVDTVYISERWTWLWLSYCVCDSRHAHGHTSQDEVFGPALDACRRLAYLYLRDVTTHVIRTAAAGDKPSGYFRVQFACTIIATLCWWIGVHNVSSFIYFFFIADTDTNFSFQAAVQLQGTTTLLIGLHGFGITCQRTVLISLV